jgi:hypothetical protein
MNQKGDVWVSAVLYIALGMVLITLILSAGLPLIEKMRDKNTIVQTKNLLFNLNANIETVANEGAGSRRYISPVVISSGALSIDNTNERVLWKMTTKNLMMEPNPMNTASGNLKIFKEGSLNMWMVETAVEGEYEIYLELKYGNLDITYGGVSADCITAPSLTGSYSFSIENRGVPAGLPIVNICAT